jgi:hypothetical protein
VATGTKALAGLVEEVGTCTAPEVGTTDEVSGNSVDEVYTMICLI